jgi:hypothetical protein
MEQEIISNKKLKRLSKKTLCAKNCLSGKVKNKLKR